MISKLLGQKKGMSQVWTAAGQRWPVTKIQMSGNVVVRSITTPEEGDQQVQIAFADKKLKNMPAATRAQLTKAGIQTGKRYFQEVTASQDVQPGNTIRVEDVFSPGDMVKVSGNTKGRGFAGVVKRWGFAGGPRTHGQSDRVRAPGSIGAGTTPGRVWKGKKMAGRYGNDRQTLENCVIVAVDAANQAIWLKGTVPGAFNGLVEVTKQGETQSIELGVQANELLNIQPVAQADAPQTDTAEADAPQTEETQEEVTEETKA